MRRLLVTTLVLAAAALPVAADTVLAKAKAAAPDGPLYVFEMDYDDGADQFRMTVDQSKPKGARVVKFTPEPATLKGDSAKTAQRLIERTEGNVWCNDFAGNIPANAKRAAETETTATYSFTPQAGKDDGDIAKAYKYLSAKAVLDKATGAVLSYEMSSPKAFKPAPVAKVDRFKMKVACKASPDGRTYMTSVDFDMAGSALMKPFAQTETRTVTNLKPVAR